MELSGTSIVEFPGHGDANAIDARELHEFLGIKKDFSAWITPKIETVEFIEGKDFLRRTVKIPHSQGASRRFEIFLTIEAAKRIAMAAQSAKGIEVRDYFIEMERRCLAAKTQAAQAVDYSDPEVVLELARRIIESAALTGLAPKEPAVAPAIGFSPVDVGHE